MGCRKLTYREELATLKVVSNNLTITSKSSVWKNCYRYVGKEKDEESGMYYYGARYYAPWLCRFVSVDPLALEFAFYTPYNYAGNKPIGYIDLEGLQEYPAPGTYSIPTDNTGVDKSHLRNYNVNLKPTEPTNPHDAATVKGTATTIASVISITVGIGLVATGAGAGVGVALIIAGSAGWGLGVATVIDSEQSRSKGTAPKNIPQGYGEIVGMEMNKRMPESKLNYQGLGALADAIGPSASTNAVKLPQTLKALSTVGDGIVLSGVIYGAQNDISNTPLEQRSVNLQNSDLSLEDLVDQGIDNVTITETTTTCNIQQGDTLSEIAQNFDTSVDSLMELNPAITDPNVINAGDTIITSKTTTITTNGNSSSAKGNGGK